METEPALAPDPPPKRVLIVDDDPVWREVLAIGLADAGYHVLAAENGAKAIPIITSEKPDVILLDLLIPVMDGMQLLAWMKEKARSPAPVVVLTCMDSRSVVVEALVAGAADVITKPFRFETLLGKLTTLV